MKSKKDFITFERQFVQNFEKHFIFQICPFCKNKTGPTRFSTPIIPNPEPSVLFAKFRLMVFGTREMQLHFEGRN